MIGGEFEERSLLIYSTLGITSVLIIDIIAEFFPGRFKLIHNSNSWIRIAAIVGMIVLILTFGVF